MRTTLFLALTIAGALGATVAASVGATPALLGSLLVVALFGLAGAAASAAIDLGASDELREPREPRGPTNPPLDEDLRLTRRAFGRLWYAALGAFVVLGVVPLVSLARKPGRTVRTGWKPGIRLVNEENVPIHLDHLEVGGIDTAFPQNGVEIPDAPVALIRLPSGFARPLPGRETWMPSGYVAYSKICTHAGCPVALFRRETNQLYCPCHQSMFDVLQGAKNIAGPAPRPLPQLGLDVDRDGYLIARGDFVDPVGPDDWGRRLR